MRILLENVDTLHRYSRKDLINILQINKMFNRERHNFKLYSKLSKSELITLLENIYNRNIEIILFLSSNEDISEYI